MIISLLGIGSETLLSDLDSAGIEYISYRPPIGVILNGPGEIIQIVKDASGTIPWLAVATVFHAWLKHRSSRKINITTKNNKVAMIEANGFSVEEIAKILPHCKNLIAMETKKPKNK